MRVVAAITPMAVVCQEEFTQLLSQVYWFFALVLAWWLSLLLLLLLWLLAIEVEVASIELIYCHLGSELLPLVLLESLLVTERLLKVLLLHSSIWLMHLPIHILATVRLLIVKEFILMISLELIALALIKLLIDLSSVSLSLHLFLLLLDCRLLGGECSWVGGEVVRWWASTLERFTFEFHRLLDNFLCWFVTWETTFSLSLTLLAHHGRRGILGLG